MPVHRIPISGPFGSTNALMALPPGGSPRAAALVLHSWWGVGDDVAAIVEGLGDAGFAALCADVLDGRRPETVEEAAIGIAGPPGFSETTAILQAGAGHLARAAEMPVTAAVGFSMGAAWAMWAAFGGVPGVRRAVCYYGGEDAPYPPTDAAFLFHVGSEDDYDPPIRLRALRRSVIAAGGRARVHVYAGCGHWFAEPARPEHDAVAAGRAWSRTVAFLDASNDP
jgi:carboxymethylenebutenolidase